MTNNQVLKYKGDSRITLVLLTLVYILIVMWGFINYLLPWWGYFGLEYKELDVDVMLMVVLFCLAPVFRMPLKIVRPSMFAYWILYFLTYIPMVIGSGLDAKFETEERFWISLSYFIGFLLLGISYRLKLIRFKERNISIKKFWLFYYLITFFMLAFILYLFRDNLSFADLFSSEAVYDTRFLGQKIQNQSAIAGHFIMWLGNALFPFLIAVGLVNKDKIKLYIGSGGLILLYMTMANKQFLFAILFTILIYKLFKAKSQKKITLFLIYLTIPTFALIYSQTTDGIIQVLGFQLAGILLLRTVYTSSVMSIYYNDFFKTHEVTNFSHISVINKFIDYPYGDQQLGVVIGTNFANIDNYNANATFFLTDGVASIGLIGVPIIALFCSLIFFLFDSVVNKNTLILAVLLIANSCIALMNVSIFTTLISGGLVFFMLLLHNFKNSINAK